MDGYKCPYCTVYLFERTELHRKAIEKHIKKKHPDKEVIVGKLLEKVDV